MKDLTEVRMSRERVCDMCGDKRAEFDGRTKRGYWAYMCEDCFSILGRGIGLGKGQRIIYKEKGDR